MKKAVITVAILIVIASIPLSADVLCPSYGSYANLCSGAYDIFGRPRSTADCGSCCAEHAQSTICDCTDAASNSSCESKVNRLEADCYAKCDAVIACSPADPYCGF